MAAGDIIIPNNTITPEILDQITGEVQNRIASTAKDPGQYEEVNNLTGITSIPVFQQSGADYKLVRVLLSILKGNAGVTPDITFRVNTIEYGMDPTVDKSGTIESPVITIGLPAGKNGEKIMPVRTATGINYKYEGQADSEAQLLFSFAEVMPDVSDFSEEGIRLLQQPATKAAADVRKEMEGISQEATLLITNTTSAKDAAIQATENAQSVSDHPGYIGDDYHVYTWDYVTRTYNKTDTVLRPEGFSIFRTYPSIAAMNADKANVPEGKFVLINTGSVEDPDTARLYVKGASDFNYLVDMSGAIGFTGKTPQITIGTVTVGQQASATLSPDGTEDDGNPRFKLNMVVVAGPQGLMPVIELGTVSTGQPGTTASATFEKNGQTADGRDKYLLNLTIPQGMPGTGSGNVFVDTSGIIAGKKYLFMTNADGSAVGVFVEYVETASYDDTEIRRLIAGKVDKVDGKQLTTEDFTTLLKLKLEGLTNYDDSTLTADLNKLKSRLDTLIGTSASSAIDTFNEITAFLAGITDSQSLTVLLSDLRSDIVALIPTKTSQLTNDSNFVSDQNYVHTDNNYTTAEKNKLSGIAANANNYSLPAATDSALGGIKTGYTASQKNYPVKVDANQNAYVNVPWTDTDTTYSAATQSAAGLMSATDKQLVDFYNGSNTVSTLSSLPISKHAIYASISVNQSLSVASGLTPGRSLQVFVYNTGSTDRTITLPTTGAYQSMSGSSITVYGASGKDLIEINIYCYSPNKYSIRAGGAE